MRFSQNPIELLPEQVELVLLPVYLAGLSRPGSPRRSAA
jgi:hypothetical protein